MSLSITPGQTVALVGASGSGKTSLVNLLPRWIDAQSGQVKLDGVDVKDFDLHALRRQIGMVSQHVVILNDTLLNNICLGQTKDRDRAMQCLIDANLGDWLAQQALGLDTQVGHNASQLSGGQRQRLAIARAMYKDAPVLILDEATSALDNESEKLVQEALTRLSRGRTTLVVAHRLSTIEHADKIVVMDSGRVAESGTHAELMQLQGAYWNYVMLGDRAKT
jgi:subfamily B ATP-binding cassette protein MsbA